MGKKGRGEGRGGKGGECDITDVGESCQVPLSRAEYMLACAYLHTRVAVQATSLLLLAPPSPSPVCITSS